MTKKEKNAALAQIDAEKAKLTASYMRRVADIKAAFYQKLAEENDETERHNIIAKRTAKLSEVDALYLEDKKALEYRRADIKEQYATEQPEQPKQPKQPEQPKPERKTVWIDPDGSPWTAQIVARRIINTVPVPRGCSMTINLSRYDCVDGKACLDVTLNEVSSNFFVHECLQPWDTEDKQSAAVERLKAAAETRIGEKKAEQTEEKTEEKTAVEGNSHVAEPFGRALDAVFGTVKKGGDNE